MQTKLLSVIAACTLSWAANCADAPPDHLAPLAFLTGHCWAGQLAGQAGRDEHCFSKTAGGAFVRDRHVVKGTGPDYIGETLYAWDEPAQKLAFTYWSEAGDYLSGSVQADGSRLVFPWKIATPQGVFDMQSIWTRQGDDRYLAEQQAWVKGVWKPQGPAVEYRRQ